MQFAFQSDGNGTLTRSAQPGKPDHHTTLFQEFFFILPGQHPVEYRIYIITFFHYNMLDVVSITKTARLKGSEIWKSGML